MSILVGWETEVGSNAVNAAKALFSIGHEPPPPEEFERYHDCWCECEYSPDSDELMYECVCCRGECEFDYYGSTTYYHEYHCNCSFCEPHEDRKNILHFQNDCSCDGEIITKPLSLLDPVMWQTVLDLCWARIKANVTDSGHSVGNHVHVERGQLDSTAMATLFKLWETYQDVEIPEIARGPHDRVRRYNQPLQTFCNPDGELRWWYPHSDDAWWNARKPSEAAGWKPLTSLNVKDLSIPVNRWNGVDKGPWLSVRRHTNEFRVWNSSRSPYRLLTFVAVSAAFHLAAINGNVDPDDPNKEFTDIIEELPGSMQRAWETTMLHQKLNTRERQLSMVYSMNGKFFDLVTEQRINQDTADRVGDEHVIPIRSIRELALV